MAPADPSPYVPADSVGAGTAVSVFGLREPDSGYYNVTLDGETTQYEAQSVWVEGAVLFYMTGLDPERTHSLTITNAANNRLAVGYINTTSVSGVPLQTQVLPRLVTCFRITHSFFTVQPLSSEFRKVRSPGLQRAYFSGWPSFLSLASFSGAVGGGGMEGISLSSNLASTKVTISLKPLTAS